MSNNGKAFNRPKSSSTSNLHRKKPWDERFWLGKLAEYETENDPNQREILSRGNESQRNIRIPRIDPFSPGQSPDRTPVNGRRRLSSEESVTSLLQSIEKEWEKQGIPQPQREMFRVCVFGIPRHKLIAVINKEIEELQQNRAPVQLALRAVAAREESLRSIKEMNEYLERANDWEKMKDVQLEAAELLHAHRMLSLSAVETIVRWREQLMNEMLINNSENAKKIKILPFFWEGWNYLAKMKSDMDFLLYTDYAKIFQFKESLDPMLINPSIPGKKKSSKAKDNYFVADGQVLIPIPSVLMKRVKWAESIILDEPNIEEEVLASKEQTIKDPDFNNLPQAIMLELFEEGFVRELEDAVNIARNMEMSRLNEIASKNICEELAKQVASEMCEEVGKQLYNETAQDILEKYFAAKLEKMIDLEINQMYSAIAKEELKNAKEEVKMDKKLKKARNEENIALSKLIFQDLLDEAPDALIEVAFAESIDELNKKKIADEEQKVAMQAKISESLEKHFTTKLDKIISEEVFKQVEAIAKEEFKLAKDERQNASKSEKFFEDELSRQLEAIVKEELKIARDEKLGVTMAEKLVDDEILRQIEAIAREEVKIVKDEKERFSRVDKLIEDEIIGQVQAIAREELKLAKDEKERFARVDKLIEDEILSQVGAIAREELRIAKELKQSNAKIDKLIEDEISKQIEAIAKEELKAAKDEKQRFARVDKLIEDEILSQVGVIAREELKLAKEEKERFAKVDKLIDGELLKQIETIAREELKAAKEDKQDNLLTDKIINEEILRQVDALAKEEFKIAKEQKQKEMEEKKAKEETKGPKEQKPKEIEDKKAKAAENAALSKIFTQEILESYLEAMEKEYSQWINEELGERERKFTRDMTRQTSIKARDLMDFQVAEAISRNLIEIAVNDLKLDQLSESALKEAIELRKKTTKDEEALKRLQEKEKSVMNEKICKIICEELIDEMASTEKMKVMAENMIAAVQSERKKSVLMPKQSLTKVETVEDPEDYGNENFTPGIHSPNDYSVNSEEEEEKDFSTSSNYIIEGLGLDFATIDMFRDLSGIVFQPLGVKRNQIVHVLNEYYRFVPSLNRIIIPDIDHLLDELVTGNDLNWYWAIKNDRIFGMVVYSLDYESSSTKNLIIHHFSCLYERSFRQLAELAMVFLFQKETCDEVRYHLLTPPGAELQIEYKKIFSDLSCHWRAHRFVQEYNAEIVVMGRERNEKPAKR
ncbi:unnamed protein product [Blepharisma stoltei]|uniref:Uncharacterized protein n=1 Tax=Blepharisma stoltei TaxID=1481888 RepID=A0AAU9J9G2_9CILI|nr:unnamed protein product [Blepharisma stoltei]